MVGRESSFWEEEAAVAIQTRCPIILPKSSDVGVRESNYQRQKETQMVLIDDNPFILISKKPISGWEMDRIQ
jgi:hypothetical protein